MEVSVIKIEYDKISCTPLYEKWNMLSCTNFLRLIKYLDTEEPQNVHVFG